MAPVASIKLYKPFQQQAVDSDEDNDQKPDEKESKPEVRKSLLQPVPKLESLEIDQQENGQNELLEKDRVDEYKKEPEQLVKKEKAQISISSKGSDQKKPVFFNKGQPAENDTLEWEVNKQNTQPQQIKNTKDSKEFKGIDKSEDSDSVEDDWLIASKTPVKTGKGQTQPTLKTIDKNTLVTKTVPRLPDQTKPSALVQPKIVKKKSESDNSWD